MNLQDLRKISTGLSASDLMPVLFLGHGSPMNGIETNVFTEEWKKLGETIQVPKAVLIVSAHWLTKGTRITAMPFPATIHDFGGFPKELFAVQYPAPGDPLLALETSQLVKSTNVGLDHDWGLDHGTWTIVRHMYPNANIPILQLSIDYDKPATYHYKLAREINSLRQKGILIIGSGNIIHNLRMVAWDKMKEPEYGYDWAMELKVKVKDLLENGNHEPLINYEKLGKAATYAIPTPDHYYPLLYTLGLQNKEEQATVFNDIAVMGSLSMTSVKIG
ncbi:4,5-DOPA-extradiol-dioxygenase [Dyadobacter psychrotolerans]|uniref:4,5-DOPA dioxygenase extradiol n=1 Tax=Dyadobacter psychrotolerans TaxID=2541721 RepID=A0A4R5E162_9BACT|nr:4,5-DOPA dioxygenase extradiol [Dyadobacter psychrotolerans]TDE17655.1 4,5-DOPA dioxygenase extradiol [Dyadobacter psychrotolerans]